MKKQKNECPCPTKNCSATSADSRKYLFFPNKNPKKNCNDCLNNHRDKGTLPFCLLNNSGGKCHLTWFQKLEKKLEELEQVENNDTTEPINDTAKNINEEQSERISYSLCELSKGEHSQDS